MTNLLLFLNPLLFLQTLQSRFTGKGFAGLKQCVNLPAGKSLGGPCLLTSQTCPRDVHGGGMMSRKAGLEDNPLGNNSLEDNPLGDEYPRGIRPQGQLRHFFNPYLSGGQMMSLLFSSKQASHGLLMYILIVGLVLGAFFVPSELMAHDGNLLKDEITALEKLFTGGYMRLGLLGVCGFAAIYGIVNQSGWIFASGILGCVFAYFMKDWITATFTMVV